MTRPRPLLLGHRGTRIHAPENTFEAFNLALAAGCDGFEFDVRLTADGIAVVVHDPVVNGVDVATNPYSVLNSATNGSAPTLAQIFERYSGNTFLDVELKVAGIERQAIDLVRRHGHDQKTLISSFLPEVIESAARIGPSVPLGYICRDPELLPLWRTLPITHAVIEQALVDTQLISDLHADQKRLFVWTLNEIAEIRRFHALDADGIISDDPRLLHDELAGLD